MKKIYKLLSYQLILFLLFLFTGSLYSMDLKNIIAYPVPFNLNKHKKKYEHNLNISFYNFFNYHNPAFLNFNKIKPNEEHIVPSNKLSNEEQMVTSRHIYSVIPSIVYNISF